jgi:hypothetical protein
MLMLLLLMVVGGICCCAVASKEGTVKSLLACAKLLVEDAQASNSVLLQVGCWRDMPGGEHN